MAKSALHPWVEARPSPLKGAFKKAFCAFFIRCTVFLHRTQNETHSHTQRNTPVIYFTNAAHSASSIQLKNQTAYTFTDANTRDKLPEASPKGPGPTHFRALAGQRRKTTMRTLVTQGLASRSPKPENKQPSPEKQTYYYQPLIPHHPNGNTLTTLFPNTLNSSHRQYTGKGGGCRTVQAGSYRTSVSPLHQNVPENISLIFAHISHSPHITAKTRIPTENLGKQELNQPILNDAAGKTLTARCSCTTWASQTDSPQQSPTTQTVTPAVSYTHLTLPKNNNV